MSRIWIHRSPASAAILIPLLAVGVAWAEDASMSKSFEGLLKTGKLEFSKQTDNVGDLFKIPVEIKGETTMVYARERTMWQTNEGASVKVIYLWCTVAPLTADVLPSAPLLKRMAELNDNFAIGNVSLSKTAISYNSSLWLSTADVRTLVDQLVVTHNTRLQLRKELLPFLQE
jgi:hypothetical protein